MEDPIISRGRPVRVPAGLIVPVGPTGSGKTSLARRLVRRGLDPKGIVATRSLSPELLHQRVDVKLRAGMTVYVDGENLSRAVRRSLLTQAHAAGRPAAALLASGLSFDELAERSATTSAKGDENLVSSVLAWQRLSATSLSHEGFDRVERFDDRSDLVALPAGVDWRAVPGPFAVIGDVHGCYDTLWDLLDELGFDEELNHPDGLFPIFAGDLADKGGPSADQVEDPADIGAVKVLRFALWARRSGKAAIVYGNHERKLARKLASSEAPVGIGGGIGVGATIGAIAAQHDASALRAALVSSLPSLPTHLRLDDGHDGLVVVHGGIRPELLGRNDKRAQGFCLFARDDKHQWIAGWDRPETVVFGHVIQPDGPLLARSSSGALVVGIDTGAYEGGGLSAYRSDTRSCVTVATRPADRADEALLSRYREELAAAMA